MTEFYFEVAVTGGRKKLKTVNINTLKFQEASAEKRSECRAGRGDHALNFLQIR